MKKLLMIGVILLAICISVSAVSAEGWSFNFGQSESSNSNGGAFSLNTENNLLEIQQLQYTIPDGYKENESYRLVGEDDNETDLPEGTKITTAEFINGDDSIIVKVFFGDTKFEKDGYTPAEGAVEKTIGNQDGWFNQYNDGVTFDFIKDDKLVEFVAPDEKTLESILETAK